jgi:hypothetical protein
VTVGSGSLGVLPLASDWSLQALLCTVDVDASLLE